MANHRGRGGRQSGSNSQSVAQAWEWFANKGSSAEFLGEWDVKGDLLAETILACLAADTAIMFGRTYDGDEVVVRLFLGDSKPAKRVRDAIELESLLGSIRDAARRAVEEHGPREPAEPDERFVAGFKRRTAGK